jgi:Mn2+/Fe2+ NRAMP family transporter
MGTSDAGCLIIDRQAIVENRRGQYVSAGALSRQGFLKTLGPGLLFAGSAVGVSHLVQSTRAGAAYGTALVIFILLAMLAKFPAFHFAPRYAVATGRSLLSSYRRQGVFAMTFFGLSTLLTVFIGVAGNVLVLAGLTTATLGLELGIFPVAVLASAVGMALLITGHYHLLDLAIKGLVALLTLATVAATLVSLPMIDWQISGAVLPAQFDLATILFVAALVGWMPTPLDVSVWQSQWTVAKIRDTGYQPTQGQALLDFNIGYVATLVLALCFLILGAAVMHGSGVDFKEDPVAFAEQIIALYKQSLGDWSGYVVGIAALAVMFSTYLTILDGFPRTVANFTLLLRGEEEVATMSPETERERHRYYWVYMGVMVAGALLILANFSTSLPALIDFGATVSFLGAPVFAYLNHRAIHGVEVPIEARPGIALRIWSQCGVAALAGFAALYIYLAFLG